MQEDPRVQLDPRGGVAHLQRRHRGWLPADQGAHLMPTSTINEGDMGQGSEEASGTYAYGEMILFCPGASGLGGGQRGATGISRGRLPRVGY